MQDTKLNDMARCEAVRAYFGVYESENRDAAEQLLARDFSAAMTEYFVIVLTASSRLK